jgi:hypothetical protein
VLAAALGVGADERIVVVELWLLAALILYIVAKPAALSDTKVRACCLLPLGNLVAA